MQQIISDEEKKGVLRNRIMVGGFSQGGAAALYSALAYNKPPLAGIIGLSTWLPLHKSFPKVNGGYGRIKWRNLTYTPSYSVCWEVLILCGLVIQCWILWPHSYFVFVWVTAFRSRIEGRRERSWNIIKQEFLVIRKRILQRKLDCKCSKYIWFVLKVTQIGKSKTPVD